MRRRIVDQEFARIRKDAATVLQPGPVDPRAYAAIVKKYSALVDIEVPTGALIDELAGYAITWRSRGRLEGPLPIVKADRFNVQGLGGKYRIRLTMWDALFVWLFAKPHRFQAFRV